MTGLTEREHERWSDHVDRVSRLIADDLESIDYINETQHGRGVVHLFTGAGHTSVDGVLFEAVDEHGCNITRIDARDTGTSVERLHIRLAVSDDRLRKNSPIHTERGVSDLKPRS